mgnify:CR=1 FL=1
MDFIDSLKQLASNISALKDSVLTEEATKNAFIYPFIRALGYDPFNPLEVIPEMVCDYGLKKGEKIDIAVKIDGKPQILIECKHWKDDLGKHSGQLFRYFGVSEAKIGILTNGIKYRFYTDIDENNKMDADPFLELDLEKIDPQTVEQVKKFAKGAFSIDEIGKSAAELKYASDIERALRSELENPGQDFVKLLAKKSYKGPINQQLLDRFTGFVKSASIRIVDGEIAARLNSAMQKNDGPVAKEKTDSRIVTTEEEQEGFRIVRSIASEAVDASRVTMRDTVNYCGILLDDNIRKQICRLHFNTSNKRVAFPLPDGEWQFSPIPSVEGIYTLKARILDAVKTADGNK